MFPSRRVTMSGDVFRDEWSLAFDGISDYVNCGPSSLLRTANFTLSCWAKLNSLYSVSGAIGIVSSVDNDDTADRSGFSITRNSSDKFETRLGDSGNLHAIYTSSTVNANQWYHIVQTYDGSTQKLYLDGVLDSSASHSNFTVSTEDFIIGAYYANSPTDFEMYGPISEVIYYNSALSASQVKTIYNGREPYNHKEGIASSNLKGWWRMGDGQLDGQKTIGGPSTEISLYNGIISDESVVSSLGADLVTNGTFTGNASGWTLNSGWAYDSNNITCSSGSTTVEQDVSAVAGRVYQVRLDVTYSGGALTLKLGGSPTVIIVGAGIHTYYFVTVDTSNLIITSSSFTGSLDNISVKLVNGTAGVMINMQNTDFSTDVPR